MQKQSVVIDLPDDVYNKYKQRAAHTQRTVEAVITEVVFKAAPVDDKLNNELEELVAQLAFLDGPALERIAHSKMPQKEAVRIEALHFKRQNHQLDTPQTEELAQLMKKFDRWFVLRNAALDTLIERGSSVAELVPRNG